jgi:hypothetical protein
MTPRGITGLERVKEIYSNGNWPGYPKSYSFFMMVLMMMIQIPLQQSVGM